MYTNARCFCHCIKIKQVEVCYWHSQPEVQKLAEQEREHGSYQTSEALGHCSEQQHLGRGVLGMKLISFIFVLLCLQSVAGVRGLFLFEDILEI